MKKIKLFYLSFSFLLIVALAYQGCSQLEKEAILTPVLGVHPAGWADTTKVDTVNFHGKYIYLNKKWNLSECRSCHGSDYAGGNTGTSCLTCHINSNGPENCRTCHGGVSGHANPPRALNGDTLTTSLGVGAHMTHLYNTKWSAAVACEECHVDFNGFNDPLHIGTNPNGIAEITFGPLARDTINGPIRPNPVWERTEAKCSSVYCHGTFKAGNVNAFGIWTNSTSVVCGTCHGDPVTNNPTPGYPNNVVQPHFAFMTQTFCYVCHASVINSQGIFIDKDKHINGEVDF